MQLVAGFVEKRYGYSAVSETKREMCSAKYATSSAVTGLPRRNSSIKVDFEKTFKVSGFSLKGICHRCEAGRV